MILCQQCSHINRASSRYCTQCGVRLLDDVPVVAKLQLMIGDLEEFVVSEAEWYIGRDGANDLTLDDPEISGRHCRLIREADTFRLEDLKSRNGTFVNGERIGEPHHLKNGDLIKVGRTILTFML